MDFDERIAATEREKEEAKRKLDRAEKEMYQAKEEMYQAEAEYKAAKEKLKALESKLASDPGINKEYEKLEKEVGELRVDFKDKEKTYNKLLEYNTTLIQRMQNTPAIQLNMYLSNTLGEIEKGIDIKSGTGTPRSYPRTPKFMSRWDDFTTDAANFQYPTTTVRKDVVLPFTTGIKFNSEKDVDFVIYSHLNNFNRIFRDQGKDYRFVTKVEANLGGPINSVKLFGAPDFVLTHGPKVLSFIEDKTPNTLPVKHPMSGDYFDLVEMYKEDMKHKNSNRNRDAVGRMEVLTVINQVYGYLAFNNLLYGCVTCYDATYFLCRPQKGRLLISAPIYNHSSSPTLLQSIYYFVHLVVQSHESGVQTLDASPIDSEMPDSTEFSDESEYESNDQMETDDQMETQETSDTGSNYSTNKKIRRKRYVLDIDALRNGVLVGSGATGQAVRLKNSNIVVKQCDTYNNPDGFQMLKNEIKIYHRLSKYNLKCIPRYYGECQYFGQRFIAMDYIPGKHCDWRGNSELTKKLDNAMEELKAVGVTHKDLRPENVILTDDGDIKLIDFGLAEIK